MRTVSLTNQKGGVGKSTLTTALGVAAAEAGENPVLIDIDPQGSVDAWANDRTAESPAVVKLSIAQAVQLPVILKNLEGQGYSLAIIDCMGSDNPLLAEVMRLSDLCLIPSRPTTLDIRAARPTIRQILAHKAKFWFVLNQCPSSGSRAAEAAAGLGMLGEVAPIALVARADFQDAFASGLGPTEYAPRGKAAEEIRTLWRLIDRKIGGAPNVQAA